MVRCKRVLQNPDSCFPLSRRSRTWKYILNAVSRAAGTLHGAGCLIFLSTISCVLRDDVESEEALRFVSTLLYFLEENMHLAFAALLFGALRNYAFQIR